MHCHIAVDHCTVVWRQYILAAVYHYDEVVIFFVVANKLSILQIL
jgi:hypothetical protein